MPLSSFTSQSWLRVAFALIGSVCLALAWVPTAAQAADQVNVFLIRQDFSNCTNDDVSSNNPEVGGEVKVIRESNGTTTVAALINSEPKTTYQFFLKCVRQIGSITTDDEGIGTGTFSFPTSDAGNAYAFDVYPNGAPAGNKFQSVKVIFP